MFVQVKSKEEVKGAFETNPRFVFREKRNDDGSLQRIDIGVLSIRNRLNIYWYSMRNDFDVHCWNKNEQKYSGDSIQMIVRAHLIRTKGDKYYNALKNHIRKYSKEPAYDIESIERWLNAGKNKEPKNDDAERQ